MARRARTSKNTLLVYEPRPLQAAIRKLNARFRSVVVHRRFGKTVEAVNWAKDMLLACKLPMPQVAYVCPTAKQAKQVAWKYAVGYSMGEGLNIEPDAYNGVIGYPDIDGEFWMLGAGQYDLHRGKYFDAVVFDETSHIQPSAWREVFRPALSDRKGKAMFTGTPSGRDWFYDTYQWGQPGEQHLKGWRSVLKHVYQTNALDPEEVEDLRRTMKPYEFQREYMCDFDVAGPGSYFGYAMNLATEQGRIRAIEWVPELPVVASWYADQTDSVTVTYWQAPAANDLRMIDSFRVDDGGIVEALHKFRSRDEELGDFGRYAEGDGGLRSICHHTMDGEDGRVTIARHMGVKIRPNEPESLMSGVARVQDRLPDMSINVANDDAVQGFRQFRATFDENRRVFASTPVNDWCAHYGQSLVAYASSRPGARRGWDKPIVYPTPQSERRQRAQA